MNVSRWLLLAAVVTGLLITASVAIASNGKAVGNAGPLGGPPPGPPLDHFVCYHVTQPAGQPPHPSIVQLADEFSPLDASGNPIPSPAVVGGAMSLCAPVAKYHLVGTTLVVYPVVHPTLHLVCFKITENPPTPPKTVSTDNQFNPPGVQRILVTGSATTAQTAISLCLPSHKSTDPAVAPTGEPLGLLSHFKCYSASEQEPSGVKVPGLPATVWTQDQFSPGALPQMTVVKPIALCNPVTKIVDTPAGPVTTPMVNPQYHLVCFSIRGGLTPNLPVTVDNQFNPPGKFRHLTVGAAYELCAPSFKTIIAPPPG
jgi:hypothetical protein